jgi:hypothetical protein
MDELESRLEQELSNLGRVPLAEPEPVANLRRRARRVRVARTITGFTAVAAAAIVVAAVVVTVGKSSPTSPRHQKLQVSAPGFVLGDIDAVVLSSSFDEDGARMSISPAVTAAVAKVPGVASVSGVIDTFAPVVVNPDANGLVSMPQVPPRSPILFSYHKDDEVHVLTGRTPTADDEIVVDADFLARTHTEVGKTISLMVKGHGFDLHIVGTFDLPGVDLTGIPLAAMSAAHQPDAVELDRIDVKLAPGADPANVRDAIAGAVGNAYTVVAPGAISFPEQRLAQVEIQHAYWALLSPDPTERSTSGVGPSDSKEKSNYGKYSELAKEVELRVENVGFLSPDAAALTFRIYYGGGPSPIITDPQSGTATRVDGHWQLGKSTLCSLAALVGISCSGVDNVTISPPNGYQPASTLDPEIRHAMQVLTDPHSTVDERIGAITDGTNYQSLIETGVQQDQAVSASDLSIAGWKLENPATVEVLYSLTTTGGPSTPWPSTATAQKGADGHWYLSQAYACGINGLAGTSCSIQSPADSTTATTGVAPTRP